MKKNLMIVNKLSDHGYPYHSKYYKEAHSEADNAEKKAFPKGYEKLKKAEKRLHKHELMGTNKRSGKIEIEKKFKKNAKEIAYHEKIESKALKRLEKEKRKR